MSEVGPRFCCGPIAGFRVGMFPLILTVLNRDFTVTRGLL